MLHFARFFVPFTSPPRASPVLGRPHSQLLQAALLQLRRSPHAAEVTVTRRECSEEVSNAGRLVPSKAPLPWECSLDLRE